MTLDSLPRIIHSVDQVIDCPEFERTEEIKDFSFISKVDRYTI